MIYFYYFELVNFVILRNWQRLFQIKFCLEMFLVCPDSCDMDRLCKREIALSLLGSANSFTI